MLWLQEQKYFVNFFLQCQGFKLLNICCHCLTIHEGVIVEISGIALVAMNV